MDGSLDDTCPLVPDAPDAPDAGVDVGEGCALSALTVALLLYAVIALAVWELAGIVF